MSDLWDERGLDLDAQRVRDIGAPEIRDILRNGRAIPFVVAVIGVGSAGSEETIGSRFGRTSCNRASSSRRLMA